MEALCNARSDGLHVVQMHAPKRVAKDGIELIYTTGILPQDAYINERQMLEDHGVRLPAFYRRRAYQASLHEVWGHVSRFVELASCIELVGEVALYQQVGGGEPHRIHVNAAISRYIICPPIFRTRHLLCLGHRKQRLKTIELNIRSLLAKVGCLDGSPLNLVG